MENYTSILQAIKEHTQEHPGKLCVADKKTEATYEKFWKMLNIGADYLRKYGVEKEDVVVFKCSAKMEYLFALFSIQLAGAVACPLEKAVKEERILEIINFVESKFFLDYKTVNQEGVTNINLKEMFQLAYDDETPAPDTEFVLPQSDDLTEILFTTGTTGKSKGIEIVAKNNIAVAQNVSESIGIRKDEVEMVTAPLNHSMSLRRTYAEFYVGGTVIVTDGVKFVDSFFKLMDLYRVTALSFVPAILEQLLKFGKEKFATYRDQIHYIQLGSAPLSEEAKKVLKEMFPNAGLYNIYGSTESGCVITLNFAKDANKVGSVGTPNVNTTIRFVDDDRKEIKASKDNPGKLAFIGGMNVRGYYKEPEITKELLDDEGVVYTSDLGYLGDDGFVYLLGRKGEVINVGGIKVAPTEVEEVVNKCEMIKESAVIPIPDEITGEALKLFVVMEEGYEYNEKELKKYMLDKIEAIKVPKVVQVIDSLPRTFNGKIIKRELKEL